MFLREDVIFGYCGASMGRSVCGRFAERLYPAWYNCGSLSRLFVEQKDRAYYTEGRSWRHRWDPTLAGPLSKVSAECCASFSPLLTSARWITTSVVLISIGQARIYKLTNKFSTECFTVVSVSRCDGGLRYKGLYGLILWQVQGLVRIFFFLLNMAWPISHLGDGVWLGRLWQPLQRANARWGLVTCVAWVATEFTKGMSVHSGGIDSVSATMQTLVNWH